MVIDMNKKMKQVRKLKEAFNLNLGKRTHLIIYNPTKAIKERKYKETSYMMFDTRVISKDNELIPYGKHTISLPLKTVYFQLHGMLKEKGLLKRKEIKLTIIKKDNYNWDITIHD